MFGWIAQKFQIKLQTGRKRGKMASERERERGMETESGAVEKSQAVVSNRIASRTWAICQWNTYNTKNTHTHTLKLCVDQEKGWPKSFLSSYQAIPISASLSPLAFLAQVFSSRICKSQRETMPGIN